MFTSDGVMDGMEGMSVTADIDRDFVGRLADGDWRAQSNLVEMANWNKRGFNAHVLPV